MKKKPSIFLYLVLTFLISYGVWGMCILCQRLGWLPHGGFWTMPFLALGANGPPIAAYFVLKQADSDFSFKKFIKFSFDIKQKPIYYAITILTVALFFIVPALTGGIVSDISPEFENLNIAEQIPLYLTLLGIPLMFFVGGSEEIGWRGVLQPQLEKKMPLIFATLIISVIWTVWHLPLWWLAGSAQQGSSFLNFFIMVTGLSFAIAAVRRVSGSVFLCVIIHCAVNSLQGTWAIKDDFISKIITATVLIIFSAIVLYWQKLYRQSCKLFL